MKVFTNFGQMYLPEICIFDGSDRMKQKLMTAVVVLSVILAMAAAFLIYLELDYAARVPDVTDPPVFSTKEPTKPPTEEPTEPPTEEPTEPPTEEPTKPAPTGSRDENETPIL